jgi:hypothetical protein
LTASSGPNSTPNNAAPRRIAAERQAFAAMQAAQERFRAIPGESYRFNAAKEAARSAARQEARAAYFEAEAAWEQAANALPLA